MSISTNAPEQAPSPAWPAARVRSTFMDFFREGNKHTFVPSSSTVP